MLFWVRRYLPNELVGTSSALLGASIALAVSGSLIGAAAAGTIAESIGFYVTAALRVAMEERRRAGGTGIRSTVTARTALAVLAEYSPAEAIDTVVARPVLFFAGSLLVGIPVVGWLAGKIAADVLFYAIAAVSRTAFDRRRRRRDALK